MPTVTEVLPPEPEPVRLPEEFEPIPEPAPKTDAEIKPEASPVAPESKEKNA